MNEEEEEKGGDLNPDALEAALGDDYSVDDEEVIVIKKKFDDEEDIEIDIAFSQDDSRDWY